MRLGQAVAAAVVLHKGGAPDQLMRRGAGPGNGDGGEGGGGEMDERMHTVTTGTSWAKFSGIAARH